MISLSTVEAKLPPGFRFHPKDEELICNYLIKWVAGCSQHTPLLIQVDLNKCEPWDIPEIACVGGKEWYFYSQRDKKYATGLRTNRATVSGYWKATGKDRPVIRKETLVGMRKTLVFYQGRAPKGRKTEWVMHEFRLEGALGQFPKHAASAKVDWVLCRMLYKSRSEIPTKQEKEIAAKHHHIIITNPSSSSSPVSLPPLMEPAFYHTHPMSVDQYNLQQVPCFSNITNPTFSFSSNGGTVHQDQFTKTSMQGFTRETEMVSHIYLPSMDDINPNYSCDKKLIQAVLNHLSRTENEEDGDHNNQLVINGSTSFGERSSESYNLSSSIWNQY